jgi:hypothetical protein
MANRDQSTEAFVTDDDYVVRKIPTVQIHPASTPRSRRVSAGAFSKSSLAVDPEQGMSGDLLSELEGNGIDTADPAQYAGTFEVVVKVKVGDLRSLGLTVVRRPLDDNEAHCCVLGVTTRIREKILKAAVFVRRPPDVIALGDR